MMRWRAVAVALMLSLLAGGPAHAVQPDEVLGNPQLESRARALSRELRCMVCQNQSIDDSDAPLARDLRILVRERLSAGDSDEMVLDFLVKRYGQFVLLRPKFEPQTALLWFTPLIVLALGAIVVALAWRRRSRSSEQSPATAATDHLTQAEQARVAELVRSGES
jgi:cytochrome c-type biogenesis protein CcmH